jgi:truncated hemoglobin YjbI
MANKKTKPLIVVDDRKIRRQRLKNAVGHNRIRQAWRNEQIKRYGFKEWFFLFKASCGGVTSTKRSRTEI